MRTGCEWAEGAGRAVSPVEVKHDVAILGLIGIEEAPGGVGFRPIRLVGEDEEQLWNAFFQHRRQAVLFAVDAEYGRAWNAHRLDPAQHVGYLQRRRRSDRLPSGADAPLG